MRSAKPPSRTITNQRTCPRLHRFPGQEPPARQESGSRSTSSVHPSENFTARITPPNQWCTGEDSNLRSSQGAADLQSAAINRSATCAHPFPAKPCAVQRNTNRSQNDPPAENRTPAIPGGLNETPNSLEKLFGRRENQGWGNCGGRNRQAKPASAQNSPAADRPEPV